MSQIARRSLFIVAAVALLSGVLALAQSDPKVGKAQEFISFLTKGDWKKAFDRLDSNLGFQMKSSDKLTSIWRKLEEKAGPFVEFRDSKVETLKAGPETFTVVTQVCKFEKGLMELKVALDGMDRVADFRYASHKVEGGGGSPAPPADQPQ
jgi:hypothetical protein